MGRSFLLPIVFGLYMYRAGATGQLENIAMRSKKLTQSFLPSVRRLLDSVLRYAATLADIHPMVVTVTPRSGQHNERGAQSTNY
jgi:hypothetical protein